MKNQKIEWATYELSINEFGQSVMVERAFYGKYRLYRVTMWAENGKKFFQSFRIFRDECITVASRREYY